MIGASASTDTPTMDPMYEWIVLLHVLGAFIFVAAHGVSMVTAFRLRAERDHGRQAVLLETSAWGVGAMYIGLLLLLVGGIWAGFAGDHWGSLWIWASIAILVIVIAVMYVVATPFYGRMRAATGPRRSGSCCAERRSAVAVELQERGRDAAAVGDLVAVRAEPLAGVLRVAGGRAAATAATGGGATRRGLACGLHERRHGGVELVGVRRGDVDDVLVAVDAE